MMGYQGKKMTIAKSSMLLILRAVRVIGHDRIMVRERRERRDRTRQKSMLAGLTTLSLKSSCGQLIR